ncbi:hypothetical protein DFH27DRAFT_528206 [Peziza echinospora]|nr:hypothetical protein DFH27DRAFT_528206 [Peziza echinospora]
MAVVGGNPKGNVDIRGVAIPPSASASQTPSSPSSPEPSTPQQQSPPPAQHRLSNPPLAPHQLPHVQLVGPYVRPSYPAGPQSASSQNYTTLLFHAFIISFFLILVPFLTYYAFFRWRKRVERFWDRMRKPGGKIERGNSGACCCCPDGGCGGGVCGGGGGGGAYIRDLDECLSRGGGGSGLRDGDEFDDEELGGVGIMGRCRSKKRGGGGGGGGNGGTENIYLEALKGSLSQAFKSLASRDVDPRYNFTSIWDHYEERRRRQSKLEAEAAKRLYFTQRERRHEREEMGKRAPLRAASCGMSTAKDAGGAGARGNGGDSSGYLRKRSLGSGAAWGGGGGGGGGSNTLPISPGGKIVSGMGLPTYPTVAPAVGGVKLAKVEGPGNWKEYGEDERAKDMHWWARWMKENQENAHRSGGDEWGADGQRDSDTSSAIMLVAPVSSPVGKNRNSMSGNVEMVEMKSQRMPEMQQYSYQMRGGRGDIFVSGSGHSSPGEDLIAPSEGEWESAKSREDLPTGLQLDEQEDGNGRVVDSTSFDSSSTPSTQGLSPPQELNHNQVRFARRIGLVIKPPRPLHAPNVNPKPDIEAIIDPPTRHHLIHKIFEPGLRNSEPLLPPLSRFVLKKWKKHNTPLCREEPTEQDGFEIAELDGRNRRDQMLRLRTVDEGRGVDSMIGHYRGRRVSDPGVRRHVAKLWQEAVRAVKAADAEAYHHYIRHNLRGIGLPYLPGNITPGWDSDDEKVYTLLHDTGSSDDPITSDEDRKIVLRNVAKERKREMKEVWREFSEDLFLKEVDRRLEWWWWQTSVREGGLAGREYHRRQELMLVQEGRLSVGRHRLEMEKEFYDTAFRDEIERARNWVFPVGEWEWEKDAPEGVADPGAYCFPRPPQGDGGLPIAFGKRITPEGSMEIERQIIKTRKLGLGLGLKYSHNTAGLGRTDLGDCMVDRAKRLVTGLERVQWAPGQEEVKKKWEECGGFLGPRELLGDDSSLNNTTTAEAKRDDASQQCLRPGSAYTLDRTPELWQSARSTLSNTPSEGVSEYANLDGLVEGNVQQRIYIGSDDEDDSAAKFRLNRGRSKTRITSSEKRPSQKQRLLRNTPPVVLPHSTLGSITSRVFPTRHNILRGIPHTLPNRFIRRRAASTPPVISTPYFDFLKCPVSVLATSTNTSTTNTTEGTITAGYIAGDESSNNPEVYDDDDDEKDEEASSPSSGNNSRVVSFGTDVSTGRESILSVESVSSGYGEDWSWGRMGPKKRVRGGGAQSRCSRKMALGAASAGYNDDDEVDGERFDGNGDEDKREEEEEEEDECGEQDLDLDMVRGSWGRDGGYLRLESVRLQESDENVNCSRSTRDRDQLGNSMGSQVSSPTDTSTVTQEVYSIPSLASTGSGSHGSGRTGYQQQHIGRRKRGAVMDLLTEAEFEGFSGVYSNSSVGFSGGGSEDIDSPGFEFGFDGVSVDLEVEEGEESGFITPPPPPPPSSPVPVPVGDEGATMSAATGSADTVGTEPWFLKIVARGAGPGGGGAVPVGHHACSSSPDIDSPSTMSLSPPPPPPPPPHRYLGRHRRRSLSTSMILDASGSGSSGVGEGGDDGLRAVSAGRYFYRGESGGGGLEEGLVEMKKEFWERRIRRVKDCAGGGGGEEEEFLGWFVRGGED